MMDIAKKLKEKIELREKVAGQFNQLTAQVKAINTQREQIGQQIIAVNGAIQALQELQDEAKKKQPTPK